MLSCQSLRISSVLSKSVLRSLASIFMVRVYIGAVMVVPMLATVVMAQPSQTPAGQESGQAESPVEETEAQGNPQSNSQSNPRIEILTRAIARYPNNAALYNSRGWYSFLDGDYTQTVSDYSQVIALGIETIDPVYHISVYHVRGLAYAELGETALAIESLQVAATMYGTQGDIASMEAVETVIEQLSETNGET